MVSKTFHDLIKEVHDKGICQECGGCVSFCGSADYHVIGLRDPYTPPEFINEDLCLECGICYYICPQTEILNDSLNEAYKFTDYKSMPIGNYKGIHSCQSTDKEFLEFGCDGGVVNTILNFLLDKKIIDGAIVAKTETAFSRESNFADSKSDLLRASGAKLDIAPQLSEVQKFCTYTHSIPQLNHFKFKKLAIVGTPCQIYTIRCMQDLGVTPSENIAFVIGLFCYENFLFDKAKIEKFEKDFNIKFADVKKVNIKQDLYFRLRDVETGEKTVHIPFNHLNDYMRPACNACNDFTNIFADISFGGLGSKEKFTTVLPRTDKGNEIFSKVSNAGLIKCSSLDETNKNEILKILSQFSLMKNKRKENYVENIM